MNLSQINPVQPNLNQHLIRLTDTELEANLHRQVKTEREATTAVLHHLREVERRRLHSRRGFASLFEYCTRKLGYSESQAQRRISSARLLAELPELESKISDGTLNLTHLSQAQSFFRHEAKTAMAYTPEQKRGVLTQLENQPARTAEKLLVSLATIPPPARESAKPVAGGQTELRIVVNEQTMQELERLKEILSQKMPGASLGELVAEAVKTVVSLLDPNLQAQRRIQKRKPASTNADKTAATLTQPAAPEATPTAKTYAAITCDPSREPAQNQRGAYSTPKVPVVVHPTAVQPTAVCPAAIRPRPVPNRPRSSRYINASVKDTVRLRDQGRCSYTDPQTGRRCDSRHQLELDHIMPHALGGANDAENLRLRCRSHNTLHATDQFGERHMRRFVERSPGSAESSDLNRQ